MNTTSSLNKHALRTNLTFGICSIIFGERGPFEDNLLSFLEYQDLTSVAGVCKLFRHRVKNASVYDTSVPVRYFAKYPYTRPHKITLSQFVSLHTNDAYTHVIGYEWMYAY